MNIIMTELKFTDREIIVFTKIILVNSDIVVVF